MITVFFPAKNNCTMEKITSCLGTIELSAAYVKAPYVTARVAKSGITNLLQYYSDISQYKVLNADGIFREFGGVK